MPGRVGAGHPELDGATPHALVEGIQGCHQFLAALPLSGTLMCIEQRHLLTVGVDQVDQHHPCLHEAVVGPIYGSEGLADGVQDLAAVVGGPR